MPALAGAGVLVALLTVAFFGAPRLAASRARSAATRAGVTITYASPKPSFSGWELSDVTATFEGAPDASLHAKHAHYSLALDELTLDDVELSLGSSAATMGLITEALQKDDLRRIEARNVHVVGGNKALRLEATGAHLLLSRVEVPQADTTSNPDHLAYELESRQFQVSALGLTVENVDGRLEGTRSRGTLTGAVRAAAQPGLTLQGSYDRAGVYLSARAPRQKVSADTLALAAYDGRPEAEHEVELALDVRLDGDALKGDLDMTVFGLATRAATMRLDLVSHVSFHGAPDALVVDPGKMRLGPFPLIASAKIETHPVLHVSIAAADSPFACADLRRAKAAQITTTGGLSVGDLSPYAGDVATAGQLDLRVAIDATFAGTPQLVIALPRASTCGLAIFPAAE